MPYKDPEKDKAWHKAYGQANRGKRNAQHRASHWDHREERNSQGRVYNQTLFAEALRALGNKCACPGCDISEPLFLTIDHIQGRTTRRTQNTIFEARRSGWDKTKFQILCMNCNFTKRDKGFCPVHQAGLEHKNGHHPEASPQLTLWQV